MMLVRAAFSLCGNGKEQPKGFARVRDNGKNVTMTVKIYTDPKFPTEYEVTIKEDFGTGRKFLESMGMKQIAYQETYREKWSVPIDGVHEITFDVWPGLPQYCEIDCTNKRTLDKMIRLLQVDRDKITYGSVDKKYRLYYDITENTINNGTPLLTFNGVSKQLKPKKNKELFDEMVRTWKQK